MVALFLFHLIYFEDMPASYGLDISFSCKRPRLTLKADDDNVSEDDDEADDGNDFKEVIYI